MKLLRYLRTAVALAGAGRMNGYEAAQFGQALKRGAGYIGFGPVVLLVDLPARWVKPNPTPRVVSLEELNRHLRTAPSEH